MNEFTVNRSTKRVGDMLKAAREAKGMALNDVHKFIKIHPKYLAALEDNNYKIFSSPVHIKGFLKVYASFLNLNVDDVLAFFRREYDETKMNKIRIIKPIENPRVFITPTSVMVFATLVLVLGFFSYLFYQYKSFTGAPALIIEKPAADTTSAVETYEVVGKTDRDSNIFLNGQKISVNPDGSFATKLDLSEGMNTLNFLAVNKLGKETKLSRNIVVDKKLSEVAGAFSGKVLVVSTDKNSAAISVTVDGSKTFNVSMLANTSQDFEATQSIKLKTSNAGAVTIKFNGKDMGLFGKIGETKEQEFR